MLPYNNYAILHQVIKHNPKPGFILTTQVEQMAEFISRSSYQDLSEAARQQLKIRVSDSLACGIGALEGEPIQMLRFYLYEVGGSGLCTLIATKEWAAPARAAFYSNLR
ncbi:hypothetical protein NONS58_26950 [Nitrosococcus oceani]|nr:hypothetical protein NONS58_26950 [Nitrosococcus oceani]